MASKEDGGLGFRDLHSFNMAILAKQGWRLIQDPESLCAKILKAKYFPNTHILEAVAKNGCSYTWRSIVQGIELDKILAARQFARLVADSARLDSTRFNLFTS